MNRIVLRGIIRDIEPSHTIDDINFNKAKVICQRENGQEDIINLRFKSFSNKYKENDEICILGNIRSYSYKVNEQTNKVVVYVFTYFDIPEDTNIKHNNVEIDGRICKINNLRTTKNGKHNLHFILANNIITADGDKRLNSYIPCIVWGKLAKEMSNLPVNCELKLKGSLQSREHKKVYPDGSIEIRVAHELLVKDFEVVN